jgi:nitrogen PTS system EIIA component
MKISASLDQKSIIGELKSKTKEEVLAELSSVFPRKSFARHQDDIVKVLMEREKLGSTGIGDGIAIPHGKIPDIDNLLLSFGRSKKGIDFDALDGKPVHLFFLLIAPEHTPCQHLKVLAKISKMLQDRVFRNRLLEAASQDDLYNIIAERDDLI